MTDVLKLGVIGRDISYSKSKDIFEIIFRVADVKGTFDVLSVQPRDLSERVSELAVCGYGGLSVTIPYKEAIIDLLESIDPVAQAIGAVNSVHVAGGQKVGYNTDCYGFTASLDDCATLLKGGRALVLGSGGVARAVTWSLSVDYSMSEIVVVGRSADKLKLFQDSSANIGGNARVSTKPAGDVTCDDVFDIVVNCTPLGGWNQAELSPLPEAFDWSMTRIYYDLNYNSDNKVVGKALNAGLRAFDGREMLVRQAVRSFEIWTGKSVDPMQICEQAFGL